MPNRPGDKRPCHTWSAASDPGPEARTPLGEPLTSRYPELAERIREDARACGAKPPFCPSAAHRLQALYLDFGRHSLADSLAEAVARALEAPRTGPARDPRLATAERAGFGHLEDVSAEEVRQRVAPLSCRALMTLLTFDRHFGDIRLGLEVVASRRDFEPFAVGACAFVAERRTGRAPAVDPRYYAPVRERRQDFCADVCLPVIGETPSLDRPCPRPRIPQDCGMVRVLEGFRFFASFPEE